MRRLLDTNAYAALRRGSPETVELVRSSGQLLMSAIVVGELLSGFRSSARPEANSKDLHEFLATPSVRFLPVSLTTADRFARISADLRSAGTPIPTNDIWIAAHAMKTGADLLSYDPHFARVRGGAQCDHRCRVRAW